VSARSRTEKLSGKNKVVRQNSDDLRRSQELHDGFHEEIKGCVVAFAEIPSGAQHARSALDSAQRSDIGLMPDTDHPGHAPGTKMASVGLKTAEKPQIIAWARRLYPHIQWKTYDREVLKAGKILRNKGDLHDDNEHAADGCAVVTLAFARLNSNS